MSGLQTFDETTTLDSNGTADLYFDSPVDQVVACGASPIVSNGTETAVVSVTAQLVGETPTKHARIRVWVLSGNGANTIAAAANRQVDVTLFGFAH